MKRWMAGLLALVLLLAAGCALADQQVKLPYSGYALMLPDGMTYDGPTKDSEEAFAYVSASLGLEIVFFKYDARGTSLTDLLPGIEEKDPDDVQMTRINGVEMLVYRLSPEGTNGMKCIGYILQDGDAIQEIVFWYADQKAADLTKTIMESIEDTGTV